MKKIIKASVSTPANRMGTFLLFSASLVVLMWVLDYADVILKDHRPDTLNLIGMGIFLLGAGSALLAGKGDSISAALFSWFGKRGGGGS